ncbi:MAG: dihydrolipoyl dehydrogenase [Alphaproteobacteria bacterium]|nr:dihydrolipoyl dehydrogenase [Alphaproteobacteria bacterium]MCB9928725.1 dihydrolipoyl dehydrogenase [Alphaproteobacteria bacterium]
MYDVVVIGGGPGGYVAAIRAAQLGMKVACVEMRGALGGTCLNVGCIPSKELLHASHLYEEAKKGHSRFGVKIEGVSFDLAQMMKAKAQVVTGLTKGIEFLFKKNKVDYIQGTGRITAPGRVAVAGADGGEQVLEAHNIVIATGSEPMPLAGVEVDERTVVTSTGAIALASVPKHLVLIGGGIIGLEMGVVWQRLGAKVTVVEFLDRIVPGVDREVAAEMQKLLKKQGFEFKLSTKVTGAEKTDDGVRLTLEPAAGGAAETLECDTVLLAIGRRPYTQGLGLETVGIVPDERGRIPVNGRFETAVAGIYAIGDVIAGPMLAHKAEDEGAACAEFLAGQHPHIDYNCIPGVVYTHPEIAWVGKGEDELKAEGRAYKAGKFPFMANARARAAADSDGFVKVLADAATDEVLGVHIIGPDAGHLIAEAVIAMEFKASAEDIARTCHAHPTLSESVKEAALAVAGREIHI